MGQPSPTDARNYAYALHAPVSGSGVVCLGVVPAEINAATRGGAIPIAPRHGHVSPEPCSLARDSERDEVAATHRVLGQDGNLRCAGGFRAGDDGRGSLLPAVTPSPLLSACWTCVSHSAGVMSLIASCRVGLCAGCSRAGWSVLRRLSIPIFAARRDTAKRCATNKQDQRLSRLGARSRSPAPVAHILSWEPLGELRGSTSTCGLSSSELGRALLGPTSGRKINAYGEAPFHRAASARPLR